MSMRIRATSIALALALSLAVTSQVFAQDATPTPEIHAQHHAAGGTSAASDSSTPVSSDVAGHLLHM